MKNRFKQLFASRLINDEKGAAALIVTIIMLAIAVLVVSTTALIGLDDLDIGYSSQVSNGAILAGESCVEEALIRLSRNQSYAGGNLTVGETECIIVVTGTPCGACIVDVEAVSGLYTRNLQVNVRMTGSTADIINWKEVN